VGNLQGQAERDNARRLWAWRKESDKPTRPSARTEETPRQKFCGFVAVIAFLLGLYVTNQQISNGPLQTFVGGLIAAAAAYIGALLITSPAVWGLAFFALIGYYFVHHIH